MTKQPYQKIEEIAEIVEWSKRERILVDKLGAEFNSVHVVQKRPKDDNKKTKI